MKQSVSGLIDSAQMWLAWHLPKRLVFWCAVRVMAFASVSLPMKEVDTLTPADCLDAWSHGSGE